MLLQEHRRHQDAAELAMMRALRATVPACLTKDGEQHYRRAEAELQAAINGGLSAPGC